MLSPYDNNLVGDAWPDGLATRSDDGGADRGLIDYPIERQAAEQTKAIGAHGFVRADRQDQQRII